MGIIVQRRKRQRAARLRRRLIAAAGVLLLGAAASSPGLREQAAGFQKSLQALSVRTQQAEITLLEREIYALQLAVFDSGERAAAEAKRLQDKGVRCVIWQRQKMRIVSCVAPAREELNPDTAQGEEICVIRDTLEAVPLRLSCSAEELKRAQALLTAPDSLLTRLMEKEEPLSAILADAGALTARAAECRTEHALCTQLAQSLGEWCAMIQQAAQEMDEGRARSYAALTMCTLCRELRAELKGPAYASRASTASAQRTPSTAAEVMPPA